MTNWTCTTLAQDYVLFRALLCKGRSHTGHNKHVLSMNTKCQVPLFQIINPLSPFATNTSIYHVLMIMPPLLLIFALTVLDIIYSSSNIAKKLTVYIFLTGLSASCFCTVCPIHLMRVRLKMWMEKIRLVSLQAASIASKIKHTDVYHQDINYNCLLHHTYNKHCN